MKLGTLRTIKCAKCRRACAVEQLAGEYQSEREMPDEPVVFCFDCAALMVSEAAGVNPTSARLGAAILHGLGIMNSPWAGLVSDYLGRSAEPSPSPDPKVIELPQPGRRRRTRR